MVTMQQMQWATINSGGRCNPNPDWGAGLEWHLSPLFMVAMQQMQWATINSDGRCHPNPDWGAGLEWHLSPLFMVAMQQRQMGHHKQWRHVPP